MPQQQTLSLGDASQRKQLVLNKGTFILANAKMQAAKRLQIHECHFFWTTQIFPTPRQLGVPETLADIGTSWNIKKKEDRNLWHPPLVLDGKYSFLKEKKPTSG